MITNIYKLKAELIARHIAYEDEMSGCSESEISEIEAKYGKLPLSYRQIISLIGHSAGLLVADSAFYVSTNETIDEIIYENEDFLEYRKETIKNNEVDDDLLKIPDNIFIIYAWDGNMWFVLTDIKEQDKDSPVYVYKDIGILEKEYFSVWEWIDDIVNTSFNGDRKNISEFRAQSYRKPL